MEQHHISDPDLERYYIGTFQGIELAMLDEHLLWCVYCSHRLKEIERFDALLYGPVPGDFPAPRFAADPQKWHIAAASL